MDSEKRVTVGPLALSRYEQADCKGTYLELRMGSMGYGFTRQDLVKLHNHLGQYLTTGDLVEPTNKIYVFVKHDRNTDGNIFIGISRTVQAKSLADARKIVYFDPVDNWDEIYELKPEDKLPK